MGKGDVMPTFNPFELADWTTGHWHGSRYPDTLSGFCFDARQLNAGQCFVALSGGARDGHEFCHQAMQKGAAALIVERVQALQLPQLVVEDSLKAMAAIAQAHRVRFAGTVVGITGSCGKTSTKEMLRQMLGESRTHATAGNWNNLIGVPMTLFGLDSKAQEFAVVEAGINQPGEMAQLGAMIQPDIAIVTMVGPAHLELLKSTEQVAQEKSLLVAEGSRLVMPAELLQFPAFSRLASRSVVALQKGLPVPPGGKDVVEYALKSAPEGIRIVLSNVVDAEDYFIASGSEGIARNAVLAIIAAQILGAGTDQIRDGLNAWRPAGNRGRMLKHDRQTFYVDCYNANPASMSDALAAFDRVTPKSEARCYILGAMNELGADAAKLHAATTSGLKLKAKDVACFVGPPELTEAYYAGVLSAGACPQQLRKCETYEDLKTFVADFQGSLFLKGSRSYTLEKLLPETKT